MDPEVTALQQEVAELKARLENLEHLVANLTKQTVRQQTMINQGQKPSP